MPSHIQRERAGTLLKKDGVETEWHSTWEIPEGKVERNMTKKKKGWWKITYKGSQEAFC